MNNGAPMVVPGRKGSEPTFWEFVTAIIEVMIYYGGRGLYQYNEDGFLFKFLFLISFFSNYKFTSN